VLRVPFNLDGAELEVNPRPADATTQRTVAGSSHRRGGRERQFDSTAVACTFMHESAFSKYAVVRGGVYCEA
jgi:hypothetical protein